MLAPIFMSSEHFFLNAHNIFLKYWIVFVEKQVLIAKFSL